MDFGSAPVHPTWAALIGAGICMGLSSVGSGYGGGMAARASCEGISRQPETVGNVTTIMLVGQAVAQTPCIFGLLVSFVLMFKSFPETASLSVPMALLSAGICSGYNRTGNRNSLMQKCTRISDIVTQKVFKCCCHYFIL